MIYTKFTKLHPSTLTSLSIILILNIISSNCDINVKSHQEIVDNLPGASDLDHYLTILERAVDYCVVNKLDVDMNLDFGLFLVGVSLNQVIKEQKHKLPPEIVFRLEQLLLKYGEIKEYFNMDVKKGLLKIYGPIAQITHLVYNISSWPLPLENFNLKLMKRTKIYNENELMSIYGQWESYIKTVTNYADFQPSLENSDRCIAHLAQLPVYSPDQYPQVCRMPTFCRKYLMEGDDFGYGLAHRLLLFVMASHSRNCAIFNKDVDKYKMDQFCSILYVECEYNALHDFNMPDLVFELVALCGLLGHAQFLTNPWMEALATYQTRDGHFNGDIIGDEFRNSNINVTNLELTRHTTGAAVATFANVVRFIIETHY